MADPRRAGPDSWRATLLAAFIVGALYLALVSVYASITPKGTPPDEWAHISYIQEAIDSPWLVPDYLESRILPAGETGNHLKHPPLYYSVLGLAGKIFGQDASEDYRFFRMLSALFVVLGLGLWIVIARMLGYGLVLSIPIVLSVNALPMFSYLAGSINNDNLAYLAVAVAFLGIVSVRRLPRGSWYVGAAGLGMALLTKGTAGLFLGLVFGFWVLATMAGKSRGLLANRHFAASTLLLVLVVGGYYAFAYVHYGAFLPSSGVLYANESPRGELFGFREFLRAFMGLMFQHLPMVVDHAPVAPLGAVERILMLLVLCLPILGFVLSKVGRARDPSGMVANIIVASALLALAAHVAIAWESYLRLGTIHSTQPRYYFYLVPALAVFAFARFRDNRPLRAVLYVFAVVALVMAVIVPFKTLRAVKLWHAPVPVIGFEAARIQPDQPQRLDFGRGRVGRLGEATRSGSEIRFRGWAIDEQTAASANSVLIYYDGRVVASVKSDRPRPDVAAALQDDDAAYAGFEVILQGVPPAVSPCDFQYVAVQRSGKEIAIGHAASLCE